MDFDKLSERISNKYWLDIRFSATKQIRAYYDNRNYW